MVRHCLMKATAAQVVMTNVAQATGEAEEGVTLELPPPLPTTRSGRQSITALPCRLTALPCRLTALPRRLTALPCRLTALPCRLTALPCNLTALPCRLTPPPPQQQQQQQQQQGEEGFVTPQTPSAEAARERTASLKQELVEEAASTQKASESPTTNHGDLAGGPTVRQTLYQKAKLLSDVKVGTVKEFRKLMGPDWILIIYYFVSHIVCARGNCLSLGGGSNLGLNLQTSLLLLLRLDTLRLGFGGSSS
ncbi:hypothetical protein RI054_21g94780 [Pseudoscourfieldia marina]